MEKTARLSFRTPLAAAVVALVAGVVHATSIVPPENLGALARISDAVVLAQAGAPRVVRHGAILYTRTGFKVIDPISGPLAARSRFSVEVLGGETADEKWVFPGSPEFTAAGVYLLMLSRKADGVWLPQMASYGILRRVQGRDGSTLLEPMEESGNVEAFPRPDGILPEPVATYVESALVPHLRAVVEGKAQWNGNAMRARFQQLPLHVVALTAPAGCVFLGNGRWPSGNPNPMYASNQADTSITDGGYGEVQGALAVWGGIGSSLSPAYGGTTPPNMTCTTSFDVPTADEVVFNDPCGDIADLSGCSGTLAQGGWGAGGSHTFDGSTWWSINHWYVVVNNGAGCINASNYTTMLAHEMGHGLGFGHTADPNSLMYPSCCQGPDALDTTCARYLYPTAGPTPTPTPTPQSTPTPTPPTSPPAAPTGVNASDGTWSDRVRILWNASAGATSYHVYRNTTNDSNTSTDLGYTMSPGADDMSAVAGTTYWYWVKAFNALGGSPFSSPDTGFRATGAQPTPTPTTVPSGPPVPTGVSASDGTFSDRVRITWNASAGATGYWIYRNTMASPPATEIAWVGSPGYDDTTAAAGQTYWYWVRAGNASGWSTYSAYDTGFRATGVQPTPTPGGFSASFTFSPATPTQWQQVQFTDTSASASGWDWSFGDGARSSARNPVHTYATRGTYTVVLWVSNGAGSAQAVKTVTVAARARRDFSGR